MFGSDAKNAEGLDRRNVKQLLPSADEPKLRAPDGSSPWLTVVGHDPQRLVDESREILGMPPSVTMSFMQR